MRLILRTPYSRLKFGDDVRKNTELLGHIKSLHRRWALQDPQKFVAHALAGDLCQLGRVLCDRSSGLCFNCETKFGRNTNCAQGTERIFLEALVRIADRIHEPALDILLSAVKIDYLAAPRSVRYRVDGEVSPLEVV